jgi:hypothetical protein
MPEVGATASGPEHATAFHVWNPAFEVADEIRFQAAGGQWRRFPLPGDPADVRLARLENGVTLVAWDVGDEIHIRTFDRSGAVTPERPILGGWKWVLASDGAGTVAVAADIGKGRVALTIRDPGGAFTPEQVVAGDGTTLAFRPVAPDGAVTIEWTGGAASRSGRAPAFASATPAPHDDRVFTDESQPVAVCGEVPRLCRVDCDPPRRFAWPDGRRVIAFKRHISGVGVNLPRWYVATEAGGRFGSPRFAGFHMPIEPVWTPGGVAFLRRSLGDYRSRGDGLFLDPFGSAPRLPPRIFLNAASQVDGRLHLAVFSREACRIGGTLGGRRVTPFTTLEQEAHAPTSVSAPLPRGAKRMRMVLTATDSLGRTTRLVRTLVRPRYRELVWGVRP